MNDFGSLDIYKKKKELCISIALEQIPRLTEIENKDKTEYKS